MSSSGQDRGKNISMGAIPPPGLNVLKRDGSVQPFDKNKLVTSISKAGATNQQATLVANRVVDRLGGFKQAVPSNQLSSMVARSLGQVNPTASGQYTSFREQKQRNPLAPTTKGAFLTKIPSVLQSVPLKPAATSTVMMPTSTLRLGVPSKPATPPAATPLTVVCAPPHLSVEVGIFANFAATASGGTPPYTYMWMEGSNTVGNQNTLSIRKNTAGTYSLICRVTDSAGSTQNSDSVTLTATPQSSLFVFVTPLSITVDVDQSVTFTATASGGTPHYTYDWLEVTRFLTPVGNHSAMIIKKEKEGTYSFICRVTDSAGSRRPSNTVTLVVARPLEYSLMLGIEASRLVNQERSTNSLPTLRYDRKLADIAFAWASQSAVIGRISQDNYVERIGQAGFSGTPSELTAQVSDPISKTAESAVEQARIIVDFWKNSPSDYQIMMMQARFGFIGVGYVSGYAVADFVFAT